MRNIKIAGLGNYLSAQKISFPNNTCYRVGTGENQITMAVAAAQNAMEDAAICIEEIELIVSCAAVSAQGIPCTAALIHEQIAKHLSIPAMDINTTCTSFITAVDTISYLMAAGKYRTVLIVASDVASAGLSPTQKESFELFSDAAAAVVLTVDDTAQSQILFGMQRTYSTGAHDTELRAGGSLISIDDYPNYAREELLFQMNGRRALALAGKTLPGFLNTFSDESGLSPDSFDLVIPHQASRALDMIMKKLGIPQGKYINQVEAYGNMVAASVPYTLCDAYQKGLLQRGDLVMLFGTAAGFTISGLVFRF